MTSIHLGRVDEVAERGRVVWRRSIRDDEGVLQFETVFSLQGQLATRLHSAPRGPYGHDWAIGSDAFQPLSSAFSSWQYSKFRGIPVRLSALEPFDAGDSRLKSLGLPADVGANGWVAVPFMGRTLVMPSLTLLIAVAMPSMSVWQRLKHPLSMDFNSRRLPGDEQTLEIRRQFPLSADVCFSRIGLCALAFWLEQRRLPCLHRALAGFGQPGWRLFMPNLSETVTLQFDAYEQSDLIVMQRLNHSPRRSALPRDWRQLRQTSHNGRVIRSTSEEDFRSWV